MPVVIEIVATPDAHLKVDQKLRGFRIAEAVDIGWKGKRNLLRSSSIGTVIGILPDAGGAIASIVAYAEARRASRTPERFGRGEPRTEERRVGKESVNPGRYRVVRGRKKKKK